MFKQNEMYIIEEEHFRFILENIDLIYGMYTGSIPYDNYEIMRFFQTMLIDDYGLNLPLKQREFLAMIFTQNSIKEVRTRNSHRVYYEFKKYIENDKEFFIGKKVKQPKYWKI